MTHHLAQDVAPDGAWYKSSYSQPEGTNCVEVADLTASGVVGVRDSKVSDGPALVLPAGAFSALIAGVRDDSFTA